MRDKIRFVFLGLGMASLLTLRAQDQYHVELIQFLQDEFQIEPTGFIFDDTEQEIVDNLNLYGDATMTRTAVQNFSFNQQLSYDVKSGGDNIWDAGINIRNLTAINQDDIVLITFWARQIVNSEIKIFAENSSTFFKEVYVPLNLTPDWTQYFIAYQSSDNYAVNANTFGFHIASMPQQFQLGGFTALNLGTIDLAKVPSTFSAAKYGGYEADAPWRDLAAQRIEELRKKDLVIRIIDEAGEPIPDVEVLVEMQQHEFGFGSALVGCRFPGNRCYDASYLAKVIDLDGKGHGFNVAVMENALKWDGWEEEWIGTPEETVSAIEWLHDQQISTRGHTLLWPGWDHMPDDMRQNQTDLDYLRQRIKARISDMVTHPVLSDLVKEWDVLNEITQVRDLEMTFQTDPNLVTGREIYQEVLNEVAALNPEMKSYINDYVVLSGGGGSASVIARYKSYLDEIAASGAPFDGIGFQSHIGTQPTSILKVKEVLDDFAERYGKRIKITEYDINENVDPEVQAAYLADFLTMIFSHPNVDAFLMWGFWDGNHWKNNAPIFNLDWSLKPAGQAFIDKVFGEWWSSAQGKTDATGNFYARLYKGQHKISIKQGSEVLDSVITTTSQDTLIINFMTTGQKDVGYHRHFEVSPNPSVNKEIRIDSRGPIHLVDAHLLDVEGRIVKNLTDTVVGEKINLDVNAGIYFLKIADAQVSQVHKLIIF